MFVDRTISVAAPQNPFYFHLGRKIRDARNAAKITQAELARAVKLSRTSVTNIEKGRQPVPVHLLVEMSQVLGVRASELIPESVATTSPNALSQINHLGEGAQDWIRRILNSASENNEVINDATKIHTRQKKSAGALSPRKN